MTIVGDQVWEMLADFGDDSPTILDGTFQGKANNVVILAEKSLTIESTPEAIR